MVTLLKNPKIELEKNTVFSNEVFNWFTKSNDGHLGRWQYFEDTYKGDPAQGNILWEQWVAVDDPHVYMQKNQAYLNKNAAPLVADLLGSIKTIVDLGPGEISAVKFNSLPYIQAFASSLNLYVPIDICGDFAVNAANTVQANLRHIRTHTIENDYSKIDFKKFTGPEALILCCGGALTNLEGYQRSSTFFQKLVEKMTEIRSYILPDTYVIFSLDSNQDEKSLYNFYKHPAHAIFEINLMHRIKRDLIPNQRGFDPYGWSYEMKWYPESYQFCHIVKATKDHAFSFLDTTFQIPAGEEFVVDNSFKFPIPLLQKAAQIAGFKPVEVFLDHQDRMALHVLRAV